MHPGVILQEKLNMSGMSRGELAIRTSVTEKHICTIVNAERDISAAFARKLGYVFDNSEYWLKLQAEYDKEQAKIQEENNISDEEKEVLKQLGDISSYFVECGYIHNNCGEASKVIQLRNFLRISDLTLIPRITYNAAYRAQLSTNIKVNPYVLFAWQRLCEEKTKDIPVKGILDKEKLKNSISKLKNLMFEGINDGVSEMQKIFSDCGIAFAVIRNFRGAPVQGFIEETVEGKMILCLTIRGKRADSFWFTLFHEIAHILNGDYRTRFVDFDSVQGKAEEIADRFAEDTLIRPEDYKDFISSADFSSWEVIKSFADQAKVAPFIVLGRLQKDQYVDWSSFTEKIVRYQWA